MDAFGERQDLTWYEPDGGEVDWENGADGALAWRIDGAVNGGVALFFAVNNGKNPVEFTLPREPWRLRIDTGAAAPADIQPHDKAQRLPEQLVTVEPHSLVVLSG